MNDAKRVCIAATFDGGFLVAFGSKTPEVAGGHTGTPELCATFILEADAAVRFKQELEQLIEKYRENTPKPEEPCTGCGAILPREELIYFDEHTRYCASCLETL